MFALVLNCELMASQKPPSVEGESVVRRQSSSLRYFEIFMRTGHALRLLLTNNPLHSSIF